MSAGGGGLYGRKSSSGRTSLDQIVDVQLISDENDELAVVKEPADDRPLDDVEMGSGADHEYTNINNNDNDTTGPDDCSHTLDTFGEKVDRPHVY